MKSIILTLLLICLIIGRKSYAFDPTGKYTFDDPNYTSVMTIEENHQKPQTMKIKLITEKRTNGHDCTLEATGERFVQTKDYIIEKLTAELGDQLVTFNITFTPNSATIEHFDNATQFCGLNAYFTGKWIKDGAKQKTKKKQAIHR